MWLLLSGALISLGLMLAFGLHWLPGLALAYLSIEALSIVAMSVLGIRKIREPR